MATRATGFTPLSTILLISLALGLAAPAVADSGPYIGASIGQADTDIDFGDGNFSDDASAWKVFGGYNFDVLLVNLAVEAAYVDFGSPSGRLAGMPIKVEADAIAGFGVAGLDLGIFGLFAKAGLASWDAKASAPGLGSGSDSGTDPAYGIGARFTFGSVEIRAEYEYFDIDVEDTGSSDLAMISVGAAWTF
jgi:hypothetical protein